MEVQIFILSLQIYCRTVQSLKYTKLSERLSHWNQPLKGTRKHENLFTVCSCMTFPSLLWSPLSPPPPPPQRLYMHQSSHIIIPFSQMCMKNLEVTDVTQTPTKILESTTRNANHYTTEPTYKMKVEMFLRYLKCKYNLKDKWHHTTQTMHLYQHSVWIQHPLNGSYKILKPVM